MEKCLKKNCSPVTIKCRHCLKSFCSKHIQLELHSCPKLQVKDTVNLVKLEPQKMVKI